MWYDQVSTASRLRLGTLTTELDARYPRRGPRKRQLSTPPSLGDDGYASGINEEQASGIDNEQASRIDDGRASGIDDEQDSEIGRAHV